MNASSLGSEDEGGKRKKCDIYTAPFNKKNLEKFPFIPHKMTKFACQETEESWIQILHHAIESVPYSPLLVHETLSSEIYLMKA